MIFTSVHMRLVLWCQKVQFLKGFVVLGLTPWELMQCLIPPPEILKGWGETTVGFWGHSYDNLGRGRFSKWCLNVLWCRNVTVENYFYLFFLILCIVPKLKLGDSRLWV